MNSTGRRRVLGEKKVTKRLLTVYHGQHESIHIQSKGQ